MIVNHDGFAQLIDAETARPIRTLRESSSYANQAEFSPDGRRALVLGYDEGVVRVYDLSGASPEVEIGTGAVKPNHAFFVLDGRCVLTIDRRIARVDLWDAATGRRLRDAPTLPPLSSIEGVGPGGALFAISTNDGLVHIWDSATLRPVRPPIRHRHRRTLVRFGPLGHRLLTWEGDPNADDGRLLLHDLDDPGRPPVVRRFDLNARNAAFRNDGKIVAIAGEDGTIQILDSASGEPVAPILRAQAPVLASGKFEPQFSPDGRFLLTAHLDATARIWDLAAGRPVAALLKHRLDVTHARWVRDGATVITAGRDGRIIVWDVGDALAPGRIVPMPANVKTAALSPDGKTLAIADFRDAAWTIDMATGRLFSTPMLHNWSMASAGPFIVEGVIRSIGFGRGPAGPIATCGDDATVRLWATDGRPMGPPLIHPHWVLRVVVGPDGRSVLAGTVAHAALLWDLSGDRPRSRTLAHERGSEVHHVAFATPAIALTIGSDRRDHLSFWDTGTGREIGRIGGFGAWPGPMWTSGDGRTGFVLSAEQGTVHVIDVAGRSRRRRIGSGVRVACSTNDGRRLLFGCEDRSARIWDVRTGRMVGVAMEHPASITAVALSPDGALALTGSMDGRLRLWDAATGQPIGPTLLHGPTPRQVFFTPDGRTALGAGQIVTAHPVPARRPDGALDVDELAQSIAAQRLDPDGRVRSLEPDRWKQIVGSNPTDGRADVHDQLASRNGVERRLDAAHWHPDRLIAVRPGDSLACRRGRIAALAGRTGGVGGEGESAAPSDALHDPLRPWRAAQALQRAQAAEESGDDRAAVAALDELIDAGADCDGPRIRRGFALVRLGLEERGAADLRRVLDALDGQLPVNYDVAVTLLEGKAARYRALCRSLASSLKSPDKNAAGGTAWLLALGPSALNDPAIAVRLARQALEGASDDDHRHAAARTLGAAFLRSDRPAEARQELMRGLAFAGGFGGPRDWALLAMAEVELGNLGSARRWLGRFPTHSSWTRMIRSWDDLEGVVLRREAELRVLDADFPLRPFAAEQSVPPPEEAFPGQPIGPS